MIKVILLMKSVGLASLLIFCAFGLMMSLLLLYTAIQCGDVKADEKISCSTDFLYQDENGKFYFLKFTKEITK